MVQANTIVARGFRAVEVPFAAPPGARSPGDPSWDPMWKLFEANGVAVVLHLGGAGAGTAVPAARSFLDRGWTSISHLQTDLFPECMKTLSENVNAGPVSLATLHLPAEVFLSSLILGGALERHPGLQVVVLEMGAQWVSSWVERMDGVAGTYGMFGLPQLKDLPSTCITRQVRITPFERNNVAEWIGRDGLDQVYSFASDFPHAEGGHDPIGRLSRTLAPLGDAAAERFFVANASSILGDAAVGATR
jgi:predicted TIM-barrel fold metal-dependent hydrolase